ncbi:MAG: hypothetical protein CMP54_03490 [Flavobacteriales bacterium]|nr:hypothetical protein [Flavobacteriales bacterium]
MKFIYILILLPTITISQLTVVNPGLEGDPGQGITPAPWQNCMPFGFYVDPYGEYATPDTHPDFPPIYEIILAPSEGDSYIGFGEITPYFGIPGLTTFQEGFSQELSSPMEANNCPYIFTIDLANGLTPDPWNSIGIETTIGELKVFGGFDVCSEEELLWESGPITNEDWETYIVEFIPSNNYTHILFEAFKADKSAECGYILADNISPITNTPPSSDSGEDQEVCESFTYLNANTVGENEIGTWSIITGNGEFTDINNPNTEVSNLDSGENIFQWSVEANCADDIGSSEVVINVITLSAPYAGSDQEICEDFTYLNANNPETEETGTWTIISGNGNIQNINDPNTLVTNLSDGTNIFEWSLYSELCDTLSDQISINYIITEPYSNAGPDLQICDTEVILNGNIPNVNEVGIWTTITGSAIFNNANNPNTTVTNLSIGENIFEWTISDPCVSVSSQISVQVEVMDIVIDEVSNYNESNISCNGFNDGFIELSTTGGYPPFNYNWSGPDNFISNNANINSLSAGLYNCIITDSLNCESTISINLDEPSMLEIELIDINDLDCYEDANISINTSGGTGNLEGLINTSWQENENFIINNEDIFYLEQDDFEQWEGLINITIVDQNGCSTSLEDILIQSWNDPIADFIMSTDNTGLLQTIEFTDSSLTDAPIVNWFWDFGDGNTTYEQNPNHLYNDAGQYNICLNIEDENGCQSEKCALINIYNSIYVYIPNVFTTNDDNVNDVFLPSLNGIVKESYRMLIYDRWGNLIFSTNNYQEGWDGTSNGKMINQGVYSYKISYSQPNGQEKQHIGKVTLVK